MAEAVMVVLLDQLESDSLVDPSSRLQHVVGPQRDAPVADRLGEVQARVDESGTETVTPGTRVDQQDTQLGGDVVGRDAEDASRAGSVEFGDPGRLQCRILLTR